MRPSNTASPLRRAHAHLRRLVGSIGGLARRPVSPRSGPPAAVHEWTVTLPRLPDNGVIGIRAMPVLRPFADPDRPNLAGPRLAVAIEPDSSSSTMRALDRRGLHSWLHLLADTPVGAIMLTNIFLTAEHGPISRGEIREILTDCLEAAALAPFSPLENLEDVCSRDDRYAFLVAVPRSSLNSAESVTTVMTSAVFRRFIHQPRAADKILDKDPTPQDEPFYRRTLAHETARPGWTVPGNTLGTPFPGSRHVWLTDQTFLRAALDARPGLPRATAARDLLGLNNLFGGDYLLALTIPVSAIVSIEGYRYARPTFADLGGERFAAYLDGSEPLSWYQNLWGLTVDLGRIRNREANVWGAPERVASAMPLEQIESRVQVDALGRVGPLAGSDPSVESDEAYLAVVSQGADLSSMAASLSMLGDSQ